MLDGHIPGTSSVRITNSNKRECMGITAERAMRHIARMPSCLGRHGAAIFDQLSAAKTPAMQHTECRNSSLSRILAWDAFMVESLGVTVVCRQEVKTFVGLKFKAPTVISSDPTDTIHLRRDMVLLLRWHQMQPFSAWICTGLALEPEFAPKWNYVF